MPSQTTASTLYIGDTGDLAVGTSRGYSALGCYGEQAKVVRQWSAVAGGHRAPHSRRDSRKQVTNVAAFCLVWAVTCELMESRTISKASTARPALMMSRARFTRQVRAAPT